MCIKNIIDRDQYIAEQDTPTVTFWLENELKNKTTYRKDTIVIDITSCINYNMRRLRMIFPNKNELFSHMAYFIKHQYSIEYEGNMNNPFYLQLSGTANTAFNKCWITIDNSITAMMDYYNLTLIRTDVMFDVIIDNIPVVSSFCVVNDVLMSTGIRNSCKLLLYNYVLVKDKHGTYQI